MNQRIGVFVALGAWLNANREIGFLGQVRRLAKEQST